MEQIKFNLLPETEKRNVYQQISNTTGMMAFAVEKDWWVVQVLAVIFDEMDVGKHIIFKGGTSLSKAWKLISRFSEDVDLAIDRAYLGFGDDLSKSQRTALRKAAGAFTCEKFRNDLETMISAKGFGPDIRINVVEAKDSDQDPRIIEIYYPNTIVSPGYLEPKVQIEIGCRSLKEPYSIQPINSLVDDHYPGSVFAQSHLHIPTANPERTFLEKVFLLHEEFQRPKEKMRVKRLSRHLYDIFKLSGTPHFEKALSDRSLYETIVEHRYKFTRVGRVNYNLHAPQTINPLPIPELIKAWQNDYQTMVEQMIYEPHPPSFDEIIDQITNITRRINNLEWTLKKTYPSV
ncbi:MAG: nucleotidyl transferase AbiEii/AbiGii toxin family protein [Candidatus Saccharimonadales bacterium]